MYRKVRKIPTTIGLFLLFFALGGMVYLDRSAHIFTSSAKAPAIPQEVHFTNITDNSFTVSWLTATVVPGMVLIQDGRSQLTYLDDTDSDNIPRPRQTHYVTVKNLSENSSYSVKITSSDLRCKDQSACPAFTQKTAAKIPHLITLPPVRGTIFTADNKPAEGAIVYLSLGKNLPLSSRVDSAGIWVIPLTNLHSQDFQSPLELKDNDLIQITAKLSIDLLTTAVTDVKSIRQNLTIPPMNIGNSYNFTELLSKKDLIANLITQRILGTQTQKSNPAPTITSVQNQKKTVDILFPASEGETTIDTRPRLRGVGIPKKTIKITVNSSVQTGQVTVGADGTWEWRVPKSLSPGPHEVTIQGYDEKGKLITVKKKFVVLKSGERVLGEATASGDLTPTSTPSATFTPTPSTAATPTVAPTAIPSPTSLPSPTTVVTTAAPPRTGTLQPTFILLGMGTLLMLLGAKSLFLP